MSRIKQRIMYFHVMYKEVMYINFLKKIKEYNMNEYDIDYTDKITKSLLLYEVIVYIMRMIRDNRLIVIDNNEINFLFDKDNFSYNEFIKEIISMITKLSNKVIINDDRDDINRLLYYVGLSIKINDKTLNKIIKKYKIVF